jgi:5-hydroxyisourate hydrolase-like protein (transthyretin family)
MPNWVRDYLTRHPELADRPVYKRGRYGLHTVRPDGQVEAHISLRPVHYRDAHGDWQPIDTDLVQQPDGSFRGTGVPVTLHPDGRVALDDGAYGQQTTRIGFFDPATRTFSGAYALPAGTVQGNTIRRDQGRYHHVLTLTSSGLVEELVIDSRPPLGGHAGEWVVLETVVSGVSLPDGWLDSPFEHGGFQFPVPVVWDARGRPAPARRYARTVGGTQYVYTGIPVSWLTSAQYPVVIDPDFTAHSGDACLQVNGATYADTRTGSVEWVGGASLWLGQYYTGDHYEVYRVALKFDTSGIGTGNEVQQVNLTLNCSEDESVTDFDVQIVQCDWSAYDPLGYGNGTAALAAILNADLDDNIWRGTSGLSINTDYTSGNLDPTWVNRTGYTYYGLLSSRDRSGTTPTGSEGIRLRPTEDGWHPPVLTVVYSPASATYTRTVDATAALLSTPIRTVTPTAALLLTSTRTVEPTAALLEQLTRTVEASAALSGYLTRTVDATAALQSTLVRTIDETAALSATLLRTVNAVGALQSTLTRTVSCTAALLGTWSRSVDASTVLLETLVRSVTVSAALSAQSTRTVDASAVLASTLNREVNASAVLSSTLARTIDATATLSFRGTRTVPATTALLAVLQRTVTVTSSLTARLDRTVTASATLIYRLVRTVTATVSLEGGVAPRSITRHVHDRRTGNPRAGVRVVIERTDTGDRQEAVTDENGSVTFSNCHGTAPYRTYVYDDPVRVLDERDETSPHNHDASYLSSADVGSGSGLDADLLDGKQASEFALAGDYVKREGDTMTGSLVIDDGTPNPTSIELGNVDSVDNPGLVFHSSGIPNLYDSRIIATGGSTTQDGKGTLNLQAETIQVNSRPIVSPQACTIYLRSTSSVTLESGAWGAIPFNSKVYEYNDLGDSMWSTGSWVTVPVTGLYQIFGQATFAAASLATSKRRGLGIRVQDTNGCLLFTGQNTIYVPPSCDQPIDLNVAATFRVAAGKYVELCALQDTGSDLALTTGNTSVTNSSYRPCLTLTLLTPLP